MVVDELTLPRESMAALLASCDGIRVVGAAGGADDAVERCGDLGADVVLMELEMAGTDGAVGTAKLMRRHPDVRVVLLTADAEDPLVGSAIEAGASACLLKTIGRDELVDAIRAVTQGRSTFSSELVPFVMHGADAPGQANLTTRELDVLTLLAGGATNKAIAQGTGLSEGTVRVYVSTILSKLGVSNRTEASALAIREGLVGS
jgi:DNA-binding NarL/FixJ family response regulator